MAQGNKTEQPTPKRLRDARKKGQVARSVDLSNAVLFLTMAAALAFAGPPLVNQIRALLIDTFQPAIFKGSLTPQALLDRTGQAFANCLLYLTPFMAVVFVMAIVVNLAQVRPLFSVEVLKPQPDKMNPFEGFKRIFTKPKTYLDLLKNIIKITLILAVGYYSIRAAIGSIVVSFGYRPDQLAGFTADLFFGLFYRIGAVFLAIGAVDLIIQRKLYMKELMMTRDEVKREVKEEEGDPHIKHARTRLHRELLAELSVASVKNAQVVVVSPTHLAIALEYREEIMNAPRIAAKGREFLARRIIDEAKQSHVPIVQDEKLAPSLFEIEIGQEIPEALYEAVAEVLNWLRQLQQEEASSYAS